MSLPSHANADEPASIDQILSDAVLEEAVKPLGRKQCDRELRGAIYAACDRYLSGATSSARKRRAYTLKHSAAIKDTAQRLSRLLEAGLPSDAPDEGPGDELSLMLFVLSSEHYDSVKLSKLVVELDVLSQVAAGVRRMYRRDRGGPEADFEFHVMLAKLKGLFELSTGKKAKVTWDEHRPRFAGRFLAFVQPILAALAEAKGKRPLSNRGLGSL